MKVSYFAEVEGYSGVRIYSRELMNALNKKADLTLIEPYRILKPEFLNKPLLNPLALRKASSEILHVTNQDDLATHFIPDKKLIVTVHDIFPYLDGNSGPIYTLAARKYVRNIEKHADKIIAISEFTKKQLLENTSVEEDKIHVIYQGVDLDKFAPTEKKGDDYYLHVGSELDRKNIPGLIRIFSKIKEKNPHSKLIRVGSITEKTRIALEESDLKLGEDIVYKTGLDDSELAELYAGAKVLLFPSTGEGFGRPIIESLATGTPVISYDVGPMKEILPKSMRVADYDEDAFVRKVASLNITSSECRDIAENYTWDKTAEETLEVYKCLKQQ